MQNLEKEKGNGHFRKKTSPSNMVAKKEKILKARKK